MQDSPITLTSGDFSAGISPKTGGALMFWRRKDVDLMRPAKPTAIEQKAADQTAMFPLVPYSNRIRGGFFIYWGIKRTVPKNHPVVADPLHGEGWQAEWSVLEKNEDSVVIGFEHNGKTGFPFAYAARQKFSLQNNLLTVDMKLVNKGSIPMPCGLGLHPFFLKDKDTVARFKNKSVWAHEAAPARDRPMKTPPEWIFDQGRTFDDGLILDTCFGGFDGNASITYPSRGFKIDMTARTDFNHIVVWSPENENFFCLEPVTNATDAFNLAAAGVAGTGIKTLDPEESLTETVVFNASFFND